MKTEPTFLSVDEVVTIHDRMIQKFGGSLEIRDYGLLESAVMMPAAQFGGEFLHPNLPSMAGAYLFHLCQNHPFIDGNKRTAVASAEAFIVANNHILHATDKELEALTLGVAQRRISKQEAIAFFRKHIRATKRSQ